MNVDNSSMAMDPVLAKKLFEAGAVLIIAGVPIGTEFGIDLCTYTVGSNFRGVKMIPPGPHFVWCASTGILGEVAPRIGFVHFFTCGEVVVREWDRQIEELCERKVPNAEEEKQRIRENLFNLDRFLAPYDYRYGGEWKQLTDTITATTVNRCRPALGTVRNNVELQSCPDSERPRGNDNSQLENLKLVADENDLLPNLKPIEGTAPRFTWLPRRVPKDAQPADVSRHCMDCVEALDALFSPFPEPHTLIEEIQLSYVFYLVGNSIESLAHWRKILNLLSHSERAVAKYKLFYMKYSEVLAYQLPHLPEELMESTERNTVYKDIRTLLINLHFGGLDHSADRLKNKLLHSMHWKFNGLLDDDPEDMPVVVETSS